VSKLNNQSINWITEEQKEPATLIFNWPAQKVAKYQNDKLPDQLASQQPDKLSHQSLQIHLDFIVFAEFQQKPVNQNS